MHNDQFITIILASLISTNSFFASIGALIPYYIIIIIFIIFNYLLSFYYFLKFLYLISWFSNINRYSDASQYDNVPVRMKGMSPKNQKKNRDVSFNIPPPPKGYGKEVDQRKDEIEILEECFTSLRTASTGTQTLNVRTPSSPTDPGYVKHTASNWPHETKIKTPSSSPSRPKN